MRAIIVGAGIGGLSAALALRRVGVGVTVYERAPGLTEVGAGISLWANALRALDHIGAGPAVRAVSLPIQRSEFRVRDGYRVAASYPTAAFEQKFGIAPFVAMVHRAELVAALVGCLPAGVARYGCECVGVEPGRERAVVRFKDGHADEADVVIGADGIRSAVRASLCGPQEPRYAGYTCWRGVCPRPAALALGYAGEWWGRGRRFGITTLPGDRVYWWATKNEPASQRAGDERRYVAEAFRGWAAPVPELIAATRSGAVLRNDIVDRPPTPAWASGRTVLIGDAAHPTTPNLGQGGCMAIEDAVVLARRLLGGGAPAPNVAAFAEDRYPRTVAITRASWRFGRLGQWEGRLPCWLRDRLLGLVLLAVGPAGLLRDATFDVGPLPATVPAGASSRDDPIADRGQVSAVTGRAGPKRPTDGSTIQRVNYCLLHIMRHSRPTGCSTGWQCAAPLLPVSFGRGAA